MVITRDFARTHPPHSKRCKRLIEKERERGVAARHLLLVGLPCLAPTSQIFKNHFSRAFGFIVFPAHLSPGEISECRVTYRVLSLQTRERMYGVMFNLDY